MVLSLKNVCPFFPRNCASQVHFPKLSLKDLLSEEVMALANTMKLARFANGPLARYYDNDLLWHVGQKLFDIEIGPPANFPWTSDKTVDK